MNSIVEQDIVSVHGTLRKFRSHNEQEAFVTQNDLGLMAGLNEGRVGSVLFYLEHHTRFNGNPMLERGEYAQTEWLLAFEHSYERRIQVSVPNTLSRQLIYSAFRNSDEYRLREREIRLIDGDDLAESLGWETGTLLGEIRNLLARHIIVRANHILIQWSKSKDEADQLITQLEQSVGNLLRNIPGQRALHNGKRVAVDLESLHNEGTLAAIPLSAFIRFQAFDTVFLLGAQALKINYANHRARLYVSVSRARQRFFFLVDKRSDEAQGDDALLPWLHRELKNRLVWL